MIRNIRVKNFKCFEKLELELAQLNVLAGINSMGKSSVIQALLLLRQSFEMGSIQKGIHLNGGLTQIGTGYDLLYRNSNEEVVQIAISSDAGDAAWQFAYDRDADYQQKNEGDIDEKILNSINLFFPTFSYVSAERIGPQRFYARSYHEIYEKNQVGTKGELYADYLAERGLTDKVENRAVLHEEAGSDLLLYQTERWLAEISPGVHLNSKKYTEAGLVGVEYSVYAEPYTPMNVGFGLSYVAPIVVCLLKAKKGDLIILENPEAHLHPKGQRKMGELIAKASAGGVQIILETHSDHLLNGIRLSVKKNVLSKGYVRLNYFYQELVKDAVLGEKEVHKKCSPVLLEDGRLSDWPEGFFDEWDKALDELI